MVEVIIQILGRLQRFSSGAKIYGRGFQSISVFYLGKNTDEVDDGYLQYIVNKLPESDSWWEAAASALTRRKRPAKTNVGNLLSDLKSCTRKKDLQEGKGVHTCAVEAGLDSNIYVANALINLYAKCGSMEDARTVFDSMKEPTVVSWSCLIWGYAENGQGLAALNLFSRMKSDGRCAPNSLTYVAALKACTLLAEDEGEAGKREYLERGRQIHLEIGYHMNDHVQSTLINLYAKCGNMENARAVFSMKEPNVVSWNCFISGYADNGQGLVALDLFSRMKEQGKCAPDFLTYLAALKICTSLAEEGGETGKRVCLERARQIHSDVGYHLNNVMQTTLINLYAKCGSMENARTVFDSMAEANVVSWNCLIFGYAENGQGLVALDLFSRMKDQSKCAPDSFTYLGALKACMSLAEDGSEAGKSECLERATQIHSNLGDHMNDVMQNKLINLYAKCGSMENARTVFNSLREPNVVSWSCLILGYVEDGQGLVALDLFFRMEDEHRCAPNSFTYVAALMACCSIGALAIGRRIHSVITKFDSHVVTCLVDFYAKCGSIEEAREVFDLHPGARNVSAWNAILTGYARFGDSGSVFGLFEAMQDQGFQPNAVTFVSVLSCCSHAGLIEKAWEYLEVMPARYGVTPTVMHYSCMIDLLGRGNKLDEAVALLQKMPCDPDAVTWTALLGACRKWKNAKIGRWAFKSLMDLDQKKPPAYVLMAEIYGSRGMWEEQERVLDARIDCKLPGKAYEFVVGPADGDVGLQQNSLCAANHYSDLKENALSWAY